MHISFKSLLLTTVFVCGVTHMSHAEPIGGQITQGNGVIAQTGAVTNINQTSQRLDINWQDFSIQSHETVNFHQPNTQSIAINRVTSGVPSSLEGALNANGRVFVMNDSGITMGAGARVNVGSFLATTADLDTDNGMVFDLETNQYGTIENHGEINISNGGFAVLAAPYVENTGTITANLGQVNVASGTKFTLDVRGDDLIHFTVEDGAFLENETAPVGVNHTGAIHAKSGRVKITAKTASNLSASVLNLAGLVDATAFATDMDGGSILVTSTEHIDVREDAILNASAINNGDGGAITVIADGVAVFRENGTMKSRGGVESGDGGFMEFSGHTGLHVLGGAFDANAQNGNDGTILLDPLNVTVDVLGDGFANLADISTFLAPDNGNNIISASVLGALGIVDVVIQAVGDVTFNSELIFVDTLDALTNFTVQAGNDILVNANISSLGNFDLFMTADDITAPGGGDGTGSIIIADGVTIDVNDGLIDLRAAGDISLGRLISNSTAANAITLTSTLGGIIDSGDTHVDIVASNGDLVVNAALGFGDSNAIETTLDAVNITTGAGAIRLIETDALTLTALSNDNDQDLDVTLGANLTIVDSIIKTAGNIAFSILGDGNNLTIENALTTGLGTVTLNAENDVNFNALSDITTSGGDIIIKADNDNDANALGGALTMVDGTIFNANAGHIILNADENITLGSLVSLNADTGGRALQLVSTNGSILDGGDADTDLIALNGSADINANATIGTAINLLDTNVSNIVANAPNGIFVMDNGNLSIENLTSTVGDINIMVDFDLTTNGTINSTSGNVDLGANADLIFTAASDIISTGGTISLLADKDNDANGAGGALTMADGALFNAGTGRIIANADGNITLGGLLTTNTNVGGDAIFLTSGNGGIIDAGNTHVDINALNGTLNVNAALGFGEGNAIETTLAAVDINAGAGAIRLIETDGLTLTTLNNTNNFDLDVTVGSSLILNNAYTRSGVGDLLFQVDGADQSLIINNSLVTNAGLVQLRSTGALNFGINGDITTNNGNIIITTDTDVNGTGALTMVDGATINTATGTIDVDASGDITLGVLSTGNTGVNAININALNGALIDADSAATLNLITTAGGTVSLFSGNGIGHGDALDVQSSALALGNTNIGAGNQNIEINSLGATIVDVNTYNNNGDGHLMLTALGDILLSTDGTQNGNGDMSMDSKNGTITVNNSWQTDNGNFMARAAENIMFMASGNFTSTSGTMMLSSDHDFGDGGTQNDGTGAIIMTDGSFINAGTGTITATAAQDIIIAQLTTTNTTNASIQLTTTGGAITDAGDVGGVDLSSAGRLVVNATTGFGDANALETNLDSVAINAGTGAIQLIETDALTIVTMVNDATELLNITAGGTVDMVTSVTKTIGDIIFNILGGGNLNIQNSLSTGNGDINLTAHNHIAFTANGDLTSTSGDIIATADSDGDNDGTGGDLIMIDGALIDSGSGSLNLYADGDITLGGVATTNVNTLQITSTNGAIIDGGDTHTDISSINGTTNITVETNIGAGNAIETDVNSIEITAPDTIQINDANDLIVNGVDGDIGIIDITANGSITINNAITSTNGNININANDDVILSTNSNITSTNSDVAIAADNDNDANGAGGAFIMADNAIINAGNGTITINADEDINLGNITTTNNTAAAITLTTDNGGIVDAGDTVIDIIAQFGTLAVNAATGFGDNGAIETDVGTLNINAGNGAIRLNETDGVTITSLNNNTDFDLDLTVGDDLTLTSNLSRTNIADLNITVTGAGNDLTVNTPQTVVNGNLSLSSVGNIVFGANGDLTSTTGNVSIISSDSSIISDINTIINSGSGTTTLNANNDITLGSVTTTNTTLNAINVNAGGDIISLGNAANFTSQNGTTTINAGGNVGTVGNEITVDVGQLIFNSDGNVAIAFVSNPAVLSASSAGGDVNLLIGDGTTNPDQTTKDDLNANITLTNGGDLTTNGFTSGNQPSNSTIILPNGDVLVAVFQSNNDNPRTSYIVLPPIIASQIVWSDMRFNDQELRGVTGAVCNTYGCLVQTADNQIFFTAMNLTSYRQLGQQNINQAIGALINTGERQTNEL